MSIFFSLGSEFGHLREGDTRLKMQLAGMVYGLELVYNFGETVRERGGLGTLFGSAIMVAGFAGWLVGRLLKAAVSRQREFLADARAVQWTRSRDGLGGVLRKVITQRRDCALQRLGRSGIDHPALQPDSSAFFAAGPFSEVAFDSKVS